MSTVPTHATIIDPSATITARMSGPEWAKVISIIIGGTITCVVYINGLSVSVERAASKAEQAAQQAQEALNQSTAVKADLQTALVALSAKLGRIEGLLEQLTREGHK